MKEKNMSNTNMEHIKAVFFSKYEFPIKYGCITVIVIVYVEESG